MAVQLVTDQALDEWAKKAGLYTEGEHARKITIVIEVGQPTRVTVERWGDSQMMDAPAPDLSECTVTAVE